MAQFVLISGAWHGAWCWDALTPLLQEAGHSVLTPELVATPVGENPLPFWVRQVAQLVQAAPEPVILLGHSRAGLIISEVGALVPTHISALVYLSGFLLLPGESLQSTMARPQAGGQPDYLRPARGRCLAVEPDKVIERFYHLAPPDLAAKAALRLHPEPACMFSAPLSVANADIQRIYIECHADRVIPLPLQRAMQDDLPCDHVFGLPADHSPFFSVPEQLARLLEGIAAV